MYRRIVVGFDGSEQSQDAITLGRLLAQVAGAKLIAACVYGSGSAVGYPDLGRREAELCEAAERILASGAEGGRAR